MKPENLFNKDERGVSPVIGVILMVAITVILAAVIGTFVLGLGDQIGGSATAGVAVDGDGTGNASVTLTNKGTSSYVKIVTPSDGTNATLAGGGSQPLDTTGETVYVSNSGDYNIVAVGPNGEQSVLRSFTVA